MPKRWTPSLEDYADLAAYPLGTDKKAVLALPRIGLAESALHAPFASFGGEDAYSTPVEQAAVLLQHLVKNHPLPDANTAVDASMIEQIAAGEVEHAEVLTWVRRRTT